MEDVRDVEAKDLGDNKLSAEDHQHQHLNPRTPSESLERNHTAHQNPHHIQALVLQLLSDRYNQSGCQFIEDCFVSWHPSVIPLHLEFRFEFLGSASVPRFLAFVLDEKTDYPNLYAIELVAATRIRLLKADAETQLLLDQVNKIMEQNSTSAWWLPIINERIRQNTISEAQGISASNRDLRDLDTVTTRRLANLINEGEIDADLLDTLIPSNGPQITPTESTGVVSSNMDGSELGSRQNLSNLPADTLVPSNDPRITSTESTGVVSSNMDGSELGSRQILSNLPADTLVPSNDPQITSTESTGVVSSNMDGSELGSQQILSNLPADTLVPSNDPQITSTESTGVVSTNTDGSGLGSQQILSNLPGDGNGAQLSHKASIASASKKASKNQRKKDKRRTKGLTKNQDQAQGSALKNPSTPKLDAPVISNEPEHPDDPSNTASDTLNAPEHPEDPFLAKPDVSAISTEPDLLEDPNNTKPDASDILISSQRLENPFIAKFDSSAISTELEHLEDSTNAKPDASDILTAPQPLEHPIVAKPDILTTSTVPGHPEDPKNTKPDASYILNVPQPLEDSVIARPDTSTTSTGQESHLDHAILVKPDFSANSTDSEHHLEDFAIAKPGVSVSAEQYSDLTDVSAFKPDLSTADESDISTSKTDLSRKIVSVDSLQNTTSIQSNVLVTSTESHRILPADLDNTPKETIHTKATGISAIGSDVSAPTSSRAVPKIVSAEPQDSTSSINPESILENRTNPESLALPTAHQNTSEDLSGVQPDVSAAMKESGTLFGNVLVEKLDDVANSRGPDRTFEDAASANSDDLNSPAEFHTPPEHIDNADFDHRGEPSETSELSHSFNSDDIATPKREKTDADVITSNETLMTSESASVTPRTSIALEDVNSSSIAIPTATSSTGSNSVLEVPSQVDTYTVNNPATPQTSSALEDVNSSSIATPTITSSTGSNSDSEVPSQVDAHTVDKRATPQTTSALEDLNSGSIATPTITSSTSTGSNSDTEVPSQVDAHTVDNPATPRTSIALEDVNSSSIATPTVTSSTGSNSVSEVPSQVDTHTVDNPATTMDQIDDSTTLSSKENSPSTDELIDDPTHSTAYSTEERTDYSISNLPEGSNNAPMNSLTQESMEGSRDADLSHTEQDMDDSSKESVSGSSEAHSEYSTEEPHEDEHDPDLSIVASDPVSGVMGMKWAYATHTPADNILLARGIWLFEKPLDHFRWQPYVWKTKGLGIEQAPVVIDTLGDTAATPKAEFDNQVLYINTHMDPWADIRAGYSHPDALPPTKLVEYQAAESMGLNVWRHDRNLLDCRLLSCRAKVADHNPETVVCLGCGPKTIIRYCSVAHMVADLKEHWHECGHGDLVIKRVVDHTTAPARFGRLCPAIRDSQNTKSYALYRQGLYAMMSHGRYTLFDWETEEPTVLVWTKRDVRREEMERRVERLLNLALFDQRNKTMVGFLFRLLRQCLQLKNSWSLGTIYALKKQFGEEFGLDASKVEEDPVCECEWVGEGLAEALHLPACRGLYRRFGRAFHGSGMRGYLEMYEARYWILRAWQQQHAAVGHWSDRAAGETWEGEVEGTSPELGPGWTVWGAEEDDRSL